MKLPKWRSLAVVALLPALSTCVGPSFESKVSNGIVSMMANIGEAFLTGNGAGTLTFTCGNGGTLTYGGGGLPSTIPPGGTLDFGITFNNCKIAACDQTVTFTNVGTTTVRFALLNPMTDTLPDGVDPATVSGSDSYLELTVISNNQGVQGLLEGNISFSYKLRILGSSTQLKGRSISNDTPPNQLKVQGKTFNGPSLLPMSAGC